MAPSSTFPFDIYNLIFSVLPQKYVLECRLVDKFVGAIATAWEFRHIRLEAVDDPSNFIHIAESDHLRLLVREVNLDAWTDSHFRTTDHFGNSLVPPHAPFLRALPFLRLFKNLKTLNIRLDQDDSDYFTDSDGSFRCYVLSTVVSCLGGTWSAEWQKQLEHDQRIDSHSNEAQSEKGDEVGLTLRSAPIELKTITISHLASFEDARLTSLKELKLLIATESSDELEGFGKTLHFLESLPRTWFAPSIAQNLRVLSLYCTKFWGWDPKMDVRMVNPSTNSASGFPNLKLLALGNYVFSHQWQVDWIASLGSHNGSGGLQELYLDDCSIMWYARIKGSLDTTDTICLSADGQEIKFPNSGYLQKEAMLSGDLGDHSDFTKVHFDLRWHHVLLQWKDKMLSLKTFKMGHGASWENDTARLVVRSHPEVWTVIPKPNIEHLDAYLRWYRGRRLEEQPFQETVFLNYDCAPPPKGRNPKGSDVFRQGVGLHQRREYMMQYIYYNGGRWNQRDERPGVVDDNIMEYKNARKLDIEASSGLMNAVEVRRRET
ncbi:hypothetical protein F5X99DRAFT_421293 [Biscogniauxia marginata]|nr:hypothetical protein F5X99DRAFT_421293 [Biscogniauxia marginata]